MAKDDIFDVEMEEETEVEVTKQGDNKQEKQQDSEKSSEDTSKEGKNEVQEASNVEIMDSDDVNPIDNIGFDSNSHGMKTGKIGDKESKFPIEKMRFSEGSKERISVMSSNVIIVKRHYHEDTGSFFCFDGKCCDELGLPDVRYLFPIVVYDTNKKGIPVTKEVEVKVLQLPRSLYDSVVDKHEATGDISKKDMIVSCNDETYQQLTFTVAGEAKWRGNSEVKKEVYNYWKKNHKYLKMSVGREITEKKFLEQMDLDGVNSQVEGEDPDLNDVFS